MQISYYQGNRGKWNAFLLQKKESSFRLISLKCILKVMLINTVHYKFEVF